VNYFRLAAGVAALVAYFVYGFLLFGLGLANSYREYPQCRPMEGIQRLFPIGIAATFVAILVVTVIYAGTYRGGSGLVSGGRLGVLFGVFAVCAFVLHNYVNLNIGLKLTIEQAVAYFFEWVLVGIVIGLIYRPVHRRKMV
jgi:hypothetical protein